MIEEGLVVPMAWLVAGGAKRESNKSGSSFEEGEKQSLLPFCMPGFACQTERSVSLPHDY